MKFVYVDAFNACALQKRMGVGMTVYPYNPGTTKIITLFCYASGNGLVLGGDFENDGERIFMHDMGGALIEQALRGVADDDRTRELMSAWDMEFRDGRMGKSAGWDDVASVAADVIAASLAIDGAAAWEVQNA